MQYYPYDSRKSLYRSKIGALAEGETLRLRLLLHLDAHVHNAFLMYKPDSEDNFKEKELRPAEMLGDYRFYECDISLPEGIFWYKFRYTSDYGEFFVTKTDSSLGIVSNDGGCWQQTVYLKDYKTPEWLKGGIIYQIFPDRFFNSGIKKENIPEDRYICEDWNAQPEYRQQVGEKRTLGNDYYGGDLKGIEQKLDYIASLGVSCIYLNPIFEAHSNHRYNTADYMKIDAHLGTEEDLCSLVKAAEKRGIGIVLDGVFSHTGDDSIYFNRRGRYDCLGAYQSKESPYYNWYDFWQYPDSYDAWWGIKTLPNVKENHPDYTEFITGDKGVIKYWLSKGIKGWRLDVADELPDEFLDRVRLAVKSDDDENFLLGEVWEDASNKISYGCRRRFLRGRQLDSVMNYPFANGIVNFLKGENAEGFNETVMSIIENYPPESVKLLMNHIGTHDTARILTRLSSNADYGNDREAQSKATLSQEEYANGVRLLKLAAVLQYTLPGVPSLYYGDEAGLTGHADPFCRATYPWGKENKELIEFYQKLGKVRRGNLAFGTGEFVPHKCEGAVMSFIRKSESESVFIAVNRSCDEVKITLPEEFLKAKILMGEGKNETELTLKPFGYAIIAK